MSGRLHYRKHYMHDWRGGTKGMPWELQGLYNAVIDEIALQEGPAKIDLRAFARLGGSNARAVKRMLGELVRRGKLVGRVDGLWSNGRAVKEVDAALASLDKKVSAKLEGKSAAPKSQVSGKLSRKLSSDVSAKHREGLAESIDESLQQTSPATPVETKDWQVHTRATQAQERARSARARSRTPPYKGQQAALQAGPAGPIGEVSALPPRDEAALARPALEGRSLATPVAQVEPQKEPTADAMSPEERQALKDRHAALMTGFASSRAPPPPGWNGLAPPSSLLAKLEAMRHDAAQSTEPPAGPDAAGDRDDQDELPQPSGAPPTVAPPAGLFAALEAAIRSGGEEEDDDA